MSNYLRYFIASLLLASLFYTQPIAINSSTIKTLLDKKLPMTIKKKGLFITVNQIDIIKVVNNVVASKIDADVKIDNSTKVGKFLPKKSLHISLLTQSIPKVHNGFLQFEIHSFKVNRFIKMKEVKGALKKRLELIKIPIKSLKETSWLFSVKKVVFQDSGELLLFVGLSKLMVFLLIPFFLLREIGLLLISFYQKFLSPKKKYKCAKGELHKNGTCSSITKEAFQKDGFIAGIKAYRASTKECKEASLKLKRKREYGSSCDDFYCCSGCNVGSCDAGSSSACDMGGCSCDFGGCSL